jgi:hypothetical protein
MKKKIIITKSQLKQIQESVDISVKPANSDASSVTQALTSPDTLNDISKAKQTSNDVNAVVQSDDNQPTVDLNIAKGETVQSAIANNQDVQKAINNKAGLRVHGDGYPNESKKYSKANIEEMRINKIVDNGVAIKKGLFEESIKTKKNYKTWTPDMIDEIYSNIEEYDKTSDDYKAARFAVLEMQRNGIKYPFLSESKFPSMVMYDGSYFVNGKLIEE